MHSCADHKQAHARHTRSDNKAASASLPSDDLFPEALIVWRNRVSVQESSCLHFLRFMVNKFSIRSIFFRQDKGEVYDVSDYKATRVDANSSPSARLRFASFINKRRLSRQKFYQFRKDSGSVRG